jgi:hypothetical protein
VRLLVAILAALILAPAALAWLPVSPTIPGTSRPSVVKLRSNTELVAFSDGQSTLRVASSGSGNHTIATGLASIGQPAIVQTGSAEELYAPASNGTLSGVLRWESKNDGFSWTGPFQTASKSLADISAATVRADGTPLFIQGSKIYQGVNGELSHPISGSAASLAVDSANRAQLVLAAKGGYAYSSLDSSGARKGAAKTIAALNTGALPIASDASGNTFIGWVSPAGFTVGTFRAGKLVKSTLVASGKPTHLALAVDPANRIWAVWTDAGAVYAKRSSDGGKTFGAAQTAAQAGVTQLAAVAVSTGHVDVFVNDGHELAEQSFTLLSP